MDERESIYDMIARSFGLTENQPAASDRTTTNVNGTGSFSYTPYTVADTGAPNLNNAVVHDTWEPIFCTAKDYSYEDSVKQILADICDILADLLYKEKLTGDHREDLASIRAFIDSIKVEREANDI